ncbi:MAG: S8 family serine peptidase [Candidatus Thorarchaeota archaeon]|nr:MAG: S8 family serine peptidase [Candidatus Thorarchaeota archaeon]
MKPQRLAAALIMLLFLTSPFQFVSPVGAREVLEEDHLSKIDDGLLNMTDSSEAVDVLVKYDSEAGDFKAKNALALADESAEFLETFEELCMIRAKMSADALVEATKSDVIKRVWLNKVSTIPQVPTTHRVVAEEEYASPVDTTGARELWEQGFNGTGIIIAVLDTGVDSSHPDLDDFDDDANTTDTKVPVYASFVEADSLPTDSSGHGTFVASVTAGTGNASSGLYAGMAPGATIISAKVTLGGLLALSSWIVSGIEWASSNGADIILIPFNSILSVGDAVDDAVRTATEKGILVVAAAGDDGPDYLSIMSPGGSAESFTVGAYDVARQEVPDFSGRGPSISMTTKPDVVAPGVGIIGAKSTGGLGGLLGGLGGAGVDGGTVDTGGLGSLTGLFGSDFGESVDENYTIADTTAASAAITAGAAAILMQAFDRADPIVLSNVMRDTATSLEYGANDAGAGLLNLRAAFDYLRIRQLPGEPVNRTTGMALIALGFLQAAAVDVSSIMMMSSFGTSIVVLDQRGESDMNVHLLMGMFSLRWNNMGPTNLMFFEVKRELHAITMATSAEDNYNRWIGVLSYDDEVYVTLLVESYNLTETVPDPVVGFRVTPFILNIGDHPIHNVSLFLSYSLDLFSDGESDHGKYDLKDEQLFAYGISEDFGDFYFGLNSSRSLADFEVGNSSDISSHVSDDNLTGSTTFDGEVGLAMKWEFGIVDPFAPVNVTITMGMAENRTLLDKSIETLWELEPSSYFTETGDFIVVEADIPRLSSVGETYVSQAIIMNVGENTSQAIAAMANLRGEDDTGAVYAQYFTFDEIEPFNARVLTGEWSPVEEGLFTVAWVVSVGLPFLASLLSSTGLITGDITGLLSNILPILDDFILRDAFVKTPIASVSAFPSVLPYAPFDIRFPADFGIYTITVFSNIGLGNLTVEKHGNASDWGNVTLTKSDNAKGFYNMSLFLLAPPIMMDGLHTCDYVVETEYGWTTNITFERVIEYPRAMLLFDTSHGGGFGGLGFDVEVGGLDLGGEVGNDTDFLPSFQLAQDEGGTGDALGGFDLGGMGDLGSFDALFESLRMTTFSGLSNLKKSMAAKGLDLVETPGMPLSADLLIQFSAIIMFNPTEEFNSTDREIIANFTSSGGKLIIFGDDEDRANFTVLNSLLSMYGYEMRGSHTVENTTEIIVDSALGADVECMWLGGGTYIMNNQSLAAVTLGGNPVVLMDNSPPEIVLFGSSRIFLNDNLRKCNNSILLRNLEEYLLLNTITAETSLSEDTTRYEAGRSVFVNLELTDYRGEPVNDLFVAIAYELPNDSLAFFFAGFVEDGLYSSQFAPSYWSSSGRINGIFIIIAEEYANRFAGISFELYEPDPPLPPEEPDVVLTMAQIAMISSVGIFSSLIIALIVNRRRKERRYRIVEVTEQLTIDIDNSLNTLLAALVQIQELIQREDIDRVEKIEMLRGLMTGLVRAQEMFERISDKIGGV